MAVYRAYEKEIANPTGPNGEIAPQLAATLANGTGPVVLFNVRTPRDVLEWLRDIGNSLNDLSSGITYVETLGLVHRFTSMWENFRKNLPENQNLIL